MTKPNLLQELRLGEATAELEKDEPVYYVCVVDDGRFVSPLPDNEKGNCAECDDPIIFRPNAPKNAIKICGRCCEIMTRVEANKGNTSEHLMTKETLDEVNDFLAQFGEKLELKRKT